MTAAHDITGIRFGKLVAIRRAPAERKWIFHCDCGNEHITDRRVVQRSPFAHCGCEPHHARTHGLSRTRLHRIWSNMKQRCSNPKSAYFHIYGGKGVVVCDEWEDFAPFRDWAMKAGYADSLQIDRVDSDGDYMPDNCRWVTPQVNTENRAANNFVTYMGERITITELSRRTGLNRETLRSRIVVRGMPVLQAIDKRK